MMPGGAGSSPVPPRGRPSVCSLLVQTVALLTPLDIPVGYSHARIHPSIHSSHKYLLPSRSLPSRGGEGSYARVRARTHTHTH